MDPTKKKRKYLGTSPDDIRMLLGKKGYSLPNVAGLIKPSCHRQSVWDVVNRVRKTIRIRIFITKILLNGKEPLTKGYLRIWGEKLDHWFGDLL